MIVAGKYEVFGVSMGKYKDFGVLMGMNKDFGGFMQSKTLLVMGSFRDVAWQ